ncbi:DUF3027 domain-containing protein [Streptomyces sp. NPDC006197]|uniref:DUF3027 domain-containing protein n=1 Tax=Streptomyces sp. NPDC006197 TaxID=3156685 RepID=UPI0033AB674F
MSLASRRRRRPCRPFQPAAYDPTPDARRHRGPDLPPSDRRRPQGRGPSAGAGNPGYRDEWFDEQCGGCRFWIALSGELGLDWGACTRADSRFDGRVRFEHDGCERFSARDDGTFG